MIVPRCTVSSLDCGHGHIVHLGPEWKSRAITRQSRDSDGDGDCCGRNDDGAAPGA